MPNVPLKLPTPWYRQAYNVAIGVTLLFLLFSAWPTDLLKDWIDRPDQYKYDSGWENRQFFVLGALVLIILGLILGIVAYAWGWWIALILALVHAGGAWLVQFIGDLLGDWVGEGIC